MISNLFHAWERRLVSKTTNRLVRPFEWGLAEVSRDERVVRPFEWGLDWIPPNGRLAPVDHLRHFVDEAMRDTTAFFDPSSTRDYVFTTAVPDVRARGEAGTLRFPSALTTPHSDNNVVHARWFPSANEPPVDASGTRGRALVVLPPWNHVVV